MTIEMDGGHLIAVAEALAWTGGVLAILIGCLIVYLLVRPPRHVRHARPVEDDAIDAEELRRLVDRMEARIETLERVLDERDEERILEPAGEGRDLRRVK